MAQTQQDEIIGSAARQLEIRLAAGREEIIDRFRESLISVSSPLVSTDELWSEAREHARLVLEECCESLRNDTDESTVRANMALSLSVGLSTRGILQTVHPADTLRSSGLLFQITLQYLIGAAADLPMEQSSECLGRGLRRVPPQPGGGARQRPPQAARPRPPRPPRQQSGDGPPLS